MRKRIFIICIAVVLLFIPLTALASENSVISNKDFWNALSKHDSPVLLKYIALENNCKLALNNNIVSIEDKNGNILKSYDNLMFIGNAPVIDASILEHDLGWTVCRHIPNTDMFHNEADAIIAGGLTYLSGSGDEELTYYVGNCYEGYYFSSAQGEHAKGCIHTANASMFYEKPVNLKKIVPAEDNDTAEAASQQSVNRLSDSLHPVFLKYILQKNNCYFSYAKEDNKITVFDSSGNIITNIKGVPVLYGEFVTDSTAVERIFSFESCIHSPDTDLFDSEAKAAIAGWFTYYPTAENGEHTFYVGKCYGGYYFSLIPGEHEAGCDHSVNTSMFYEKQVVIKDGVLLHDTAIKDRNDDDFVSYTLNSRKIIADKPEKALTKMVTVIHTEYDKKEGVQTAYFSYRDRVYRNFWEDLANYDVTDYIFIPPDLPKLEEYKSFSNEAAINMTNAIGQLLNFNSNAKLWIGTPGITSQNYNHEAISDDVIADFLNDVKARLGGGVWEQNVEGVYINQEAIYPDEVTAQVNRIKSIVKLFKAKYPEKKALWIPYYDLAADSSEIAGKIAEVSRIPDLFDYIVIQPGYFFFDQSNGVPDPETTSHRSKNIDAVMRSAQNNYVTNPLGMPVDGELSNSTIGFEMEPQASYFSNSRETREESIDRYTKYLLAGAKVKDIGPIAFYTSGDPHCNKELLVYKFYEADELGERAVRKKLDSGLEEFFSYVFETREKDKIFQEYAKKIYLAADENNSEESFMEAYNAGLIIPEFYGYEKRNGMDDLAGYIENGGVLNDIFNGIILKHLGIAG